MNNTVTASGEKSSREVRQGLLLGGLAVLVIVLAIISLFVGRLGIGGVADLLAVQGQDPETFRILLIEVRLPRTLLALTVGATLGLSGAVLQGLLRNPLAEPFILGASSSAALGAVIVFYFGVAGGSALATPLGGVAGTMVATSALLFLGGRAQDPLTLILAGVALNALAAALTSLALNLAPSPYAALEIVFWILGSFADRSLDHLVLALPLMGIGWVLLFSTWRALDALSLGEDAAASLGFNLAAIKVRAILGCAFAVGAAVATTGVISFVGLVVPHVLRPFIGYRPSRLLPASFLGGAALMLAADIGVRLIDTQLELKIGVLTALIGTPFFFHLLYVLRRGGR
ncbi:MAG: iron ABC transporter permease [Rhodospirillaceae bacterium]|jgi:iron complex transport system permease protein|nr:iron ABC transporter permease [Rhodospirillaceae bacterium]